MEKSNIQKAVFGGGCFWCLEAVFQRVKGVQKVISGYAGGNIEKPTYEEVSSGETGHAEVVQLEFDPAIVSYEQLLDVFWHLHDPTTLNRQGNDVGTQYRSMIIYMNAEQKAAAELSRDELERQKVYKNPIVTEIVPFTDFYEAESYHQNYYNNNKNAPYCRIIIDPKVRKLLQSYSTMVT
ncbi:MAG: peptide-methionine (S)-S-oxide reductase MsrA [Candidatus Dojkabacteria bacterium]|nr:MAG: peptide-methionine (S)-S-oxide reductase MsrA [Candidatus Dojkabacteria bacterium]